MNQKVTTATRPLPSADRTGAALSRTAIITTSRLLAGGVVAGPLFVLVALVQVLTRPGFDITRHPISMLSLGSLGWIQSANFLVTGILTIACAVGMRRVLRDGPGGWGVPALLGVYGTGFMAASVFHVDPGNGFPPGTPDGMPTAMSGQGMLHMVFGSVAFLALIAVCFVLARRFATSEQRGWAIGSGVAGLLFLAGLGQAMSGGLDGSLTLFVGASVALLWVAVIAGRLIIEQTTAVSSEALGPAST